MDGALGAQAVPLTGTRPQPAPSLASPTPAMLGVLESSSMPSLGVRPRPGRPAARDPGKPEELDHANGPGPGLRVGPLRRGVRLWCPPLEWRPWVPAGLRGVTFSPRLSSFSERRISLVRMFILSHSWKATTTYGVFSAALAMISAMLNISGTFSRISSSTAFTWKSGPDKPRHRTRPPSGSGSGACPDVQGEGSWSIGQRSCLRIRVTEVQPPI